MNKNDSTNRRAVLVLSLSGIGNFIMHTPTLRAIKGAHPEWQVTVWVAPSGAKALADIEPGVDDVIEAPIRLSPTRHVKMALGLARRHFDIGVVLSPGQRVKSAAYLYLAGIPMRIGNNYAFDQKSDSSFLLTNAVVEDKSIHDVEQNLRLLHPLGIIAPEAAKSPYQLPLLPSNAQRKANEILDNLPVNFSATKLIGFHAGSSMAMAWKRWPAENFVVVAKALLQARDVHILLFGGEAETEINESLKKQIGERCTIISTDLLSTAAVMSHCAQFLSNDSGLMHLAAATGVPTYGLFGPTDETLTGPRGEHSFVIRAPGTKPVYDTDTNFKPGKEAQHSLEAISPELVLESLVKT